MTHRIPTHLTDSQLIEEVKRSARGEREATVQLVAHLAEMDARMLHRGLGFPSLFAYCLEVLHLGEGATCKRIDVARAARQLPVLLDRLADGSLNLTTAALIARKLTRENHQELIAAARGLPTRRVEEMIARHFPKPDVVPMVRKLPAPRTGAIPSVPQVLDAMTAPAVAPPSAPVPVPSSPPQRLATPLSADRYQIRFMASAATWKKLQVARDLLRHAVPGGDPGEIFDRALDALIENVAKKKCGAAEAPARRARATAPGSRHVPAKVRRAVWVRDQGRCAFIAASGRRCQERGRLEYHHVEPYGAGGAATVANIQLRCRPHNQYESLLFYGPSKAVGADGVVRERPPSYGLSPELSTVRADGKSGADRFRAGAT